MSERFGHVAISKVDPPLSMFTRKGTGRGVAIWGEPLLALEVGECLRLEAADKRDAVLLRNAIRHCVGSSRRRGGGRWFQRHYTMKVDGACLYVLRLDDRPEAEAQP